MATITIDLGKQGYDIDIVTDSWEDLGTWLASQHFSRQALIVSDDRVGPLYGAAVQKSLAEQGIIASLYCFPEGEPSKNLTEANHIFTKAIEASLDRNSLIVALGGGVVGDMAGFVAATYLRGVPFIQVPTSLLAQVDSSVGGKVAVDHILGKNLIGAFYQPRHVHMNLAVLRTLSPRQFRAGMAEVIKHGLLADLTLFEYVEEYTAEILALEPQAVSFLIQRCCEIKGSFVSADEKEQGSRMALNLGHTIGHAVEAASNFDYLHGEAISVGMMGALYLSEQVTGLAKKISDRAHKVFTAYGLPVIAPNFEKSILMDYIWRDKKNADQQIRWILLSEIGKWHVSSTVSEPVLDSVLSRLVNPSMQ